MASIDYDWYSCNAQDGIETHFVTKDSEIPFLSLSSARGTLANHEVGVTHSVELKCAYRAALFTMISRRLSFLANVSAARLTSFRSLTSATKGTKLPDGIDGDAL